WSYSLLDDATKAVFVRLGVFAGSFETRAAEEIVSGDGLEAWDVVDGLRELVGKSLVSVDDAIPGVTRYHLLETLRAYARERLDEQGDADHWRRRHATHYAGFAEEAGSMMFGPDWLDWLPRVGADLDPRAVPGALGRSGRGPRDARTRPRGLPRRRHPRMARRPPVPGALVRRSVARCARRARARAGESADRPSPGESDTAERRALQRRLHELARRARGCHRRARGEHRAVARRRSVR